MPRIPEVPTLDPVNKPLMSPAEAGKPGQAIAELGEAGNYAAEAGLDLDLYRKKAHQTVDELKSGNQFNAAMMKYQEALKKTTNSHDVAAVVKEFQDNINDIEKQWGSSPASVRIQMQGESLRSSIDHYGTMKTIELQTKEGAAQSEIQLQTLLPQLVTAQRNGDKAQVDYINGYIHHIYDSLTASGLMSDADKEIALNKAQIQYRNQLNESYISSADPKERLEAIQQLKTGGSGPLNLADLAPGDVAALRARAEDTNEKLNNIAEAQNLNRDLNVVQNAFQAPQYKSNYEARINSLQDGDWLTKNGIVNEDGTPDRVMAEKLIAETNRQRAEWEKEQNDRDEKVAENISPLIDEHKISLGQLNTVLDQTEGISPKVRAQLVRQWREDTNESIRLSNESYEVSQRMKAEKSQDAAAGWVLRISQGEVPSNADIMTTPGMSRADKAMVTGYRDKAKADKPYQGGLTIITAAYPETDDMSIGERSLQHQYYLRTVQAYDQEINAHPDEDKSAIASRLVMPGIVRNAILNSVQSILPTQPSMWDRLKLDTSDVMNFLEDKTPPAGEGGAPSTSSTEATPKQPSTGTQTFTDGGKVYHIPVGLVDDFKKDHPNAR